MIKIAGAVFPEDHTVMRIIFLNAVMVRIEGVQITHVTGLIPQYLTMKILRKIQLIKKNPNLQTIRNVSKVISRIANFMM